MIIFYWIEELSLSRTVHEEDSGCQPRTDALIYALVKSREKMKLRNHAAFPSIPMPLEKPAIPTIEPVIWISKSQSSEHTEWDGFKQELATACKIINKQWPSQVPNHDTPEQIRDPIQPSWYVRANW